MTVNCLINLLRFLVLNTKFSCFDGLEVFTFGDIISYHDGIGKW